MHMGVGLIYKSENISGKPFRNARALQGRPNRIFAYIVRIYRYSAAGIFRINVLGAIPADPAMRNSCIRRPCMSAMGSSPPRCLCRESDARPLQKSSIVHTLYQPMRIIYRYAVSRVTPEDFRMFLYICTASGAQPFLIHVPPK